MVKGVEGADVVLTGSFDRPLVPRVEQVRYLKAFAQPRVGEVRLRGATPGSSLTIRWDVAANPCLGLWLTRGGYRGWHHLAIEPASGAHDRLDLAAKSSSRGSRIGPQEKRTWWVEWRVAG